MAVTDALKALVEVARGIDNVELKQRLLDLQQEASDLVQENQELRAQNQELRERLRFQGELEFDDGVYWKQNEHEERTGPFCTWCWDDDRKLIRLHDRGNGYFGCK